MHVRWQSFVTGPALAICAAVALMLGGCGQGEYDSRMGNIPQMLAARQAAMVNNLVMKEFFSVTDPAGAPSGIKLRLPLAFSGDKATSLGAEAPAAKIPQFDIPGFCYTLESKQADGSGKQVPNYLYLHVVSKKTTTAAQLREAIKQQAVAAGAAEANWRPTLPSREPGAIAGQMLDVSKDFEFVVGEAIENLPGKILLCMYESPENIAVFGWRYDTNGGIL